MAFHIAIIGLGLMGGSLAMALQGFRNAVISGMDANPSVRALAQNSGVFATVYDDVPQAIRDADLIIFCTYPESILSYLTEYAPLCKKGALVTEICGTKRHISQLAENLPIDYVGIHPMAGKEVSGFAQAEAAIFKGTGFILTPTPQSSPDSVKLLTELATYIGATRIAVTDASTHDDIIAYSSDLMHIAATALCVSFPPTITRAFTAGAFRDCTRVAEINPTLWTSLLLENGDYILPHLDRFITHLQDMRKAIDTSDHATLHTLLTTANDHKKEMQGR